MATKDFLQEIGRVSANFSTLEMYLELLFAGLVNPNDRVGRAIWANLGGVSQRLNMLSAVGIERCGKEKADATVLKLVSLVRGVNKRRNEVVHSTYIWALPGEGDPLPPDTVLTYRTQSSEKGFAWTSAEVKMSDIHKLGSDIGNVVTVAQEVLNQLISEDILYPHVSGRK